VNWTPFMHGLGIGCLICIAPIAVAIIVDSLAPNWRRIWDTACGRPWPIARHPVPPAASVLPLRTSVPKLLVVEADAQPTYSKHVA